MRLRNRIVKATTWTDGDLLRWHRDKREFYRSLWACAEDSCCIIDDMFEVKLTAWASPMDADITVDQLEEWRDELIECEKLIPYEVGGKRYFFIPGMAEHERPRNPQPPDWPLPPWVTYELTGDGRNRRCTYTFSYTSGNRNTSVQSYPGNRNTSPALPCPVLPCPDLSEEPRDDDKPDGKIMTSTGHPPCLDADIEVIDPAYTGSCWGFIVYSAEAQFGGILSHAERTELAEAVTQGCIHGCTGEHPVECAVHIYDKLKLKGKTRFATSRLWLKCIREDRMEVRQ